MKTDITKLGVDNDNLNIDFQTKLKDIMNGLAQRDQKIIETITIEKK